MRTRNHVHTDHFAFNGFNGLRASVGGGFNGRYVADNHGCYHGIADLHAKLSKQLGDAHEAEHRMLEALAEQLWEAQRGNKPPSEMAYLERLRGMA